MPRPAARRLLLAPSYPPPLAITVTSNVTWDSSTTGQPYQVDVYQPTTPLSPTPPAIIVAHGRFDGTDTKTNTDVVSIAQHLAKAGFVVLAPNWYPQTATNGTADTTVTPNQTTHFRSFLTWARGQGATYHYDQTRIGMIGGSGGGGTGSVAAMVGVAGGTRPDALAEWSGVVSLPTMSVGGAGSNYAGCAAYCGVDYSLLLAILNDLPKGYWRLGEASGTSAADASGNLNTGAYINNPTLGVAGGLSGDTNTAVTLDGSTQYVSIPNAAGINVGDTFTLECRVKRSSTTGTSQVLMSKGNNSFMLRFNTSDQVELCKNLTVCGHSTATITDTNWHHIVLTKAGATIALYIDGGASDWTLVAAQTMATSGLPLQIGQFGLANYLNGTIDEVAIWNTALSATRAAAHYQCIAGGAANATIWNNVSAAILTPPAAICPVFITGSADDTVPLDQGQAFLSNIAGIAGVDATFFPLGTLPVANEHGASLWPYVLFTCAKWLASRLAFPAVNLWGRDLVS